MKKANRKPQRGQGLVESLLCLPILSVLITSVGILAYRAAVYHLAHYHLHEALICQSDDKNRDCQNELEKKMKSILLTKHKVTTRLRKNFRRLEGSVHVDFRPPLTVEQTFK